jgi:hypothetical protein
MDKAKIEAREAKAELVRSIYKYRSELYRQEAKRKATLPAARHYAKLNHMEMMEAYHEANTNTGKIIDFLKGEIKVLAVMLEGLNKVA